MKSKLLPGIIFFLAICSMGTAWSQGAAADTAFLQSAKAEAVAVYKQAVGKQIHLFNGPEYVEYRRPQLEGHPYFETDKLTEGDVYYDGAWFRQVPIRYDVITDEVMTSNGGALQKLLPSRLTSFNLNGHTFVRIVSDSVAGAGLQTGYYDLLHNDTVVVIAKRVKDVQERVARGRIEGEYQVIDKFYIGKEGTYYQVNSLNSVLNVFPAQKKQLRKHLQAKKLKFNRNKEAVLIEAAKFYATHKE